MTDYKYKMVVFKRWDDRGKVSEEKSNSLEYFDRNKGKKNYRIEIFERSKNRWNKIYSEI